MAAPGTASYKRLYRRVAKAYNAITSGTYGNATPTLRSRVREAAHFRDAIVAKDAMVRVAICMSEQSPHRGRYMDYSGELNHGDKIPDRYGPIGEVLIKVASSGDFESAIEADSLEQINQWRKNAGNAFGALAHTAAGSPLGGYFFIDRKGRIRFTGTKAKVEICAIDISGEAVDPPVLGAPDGFEDVIFAGSVGDLPILGDDYSQAHHHREYFAQMMSLIQAGAFEVPPFQQK